jgi:hypothetical protein
VPSSHGFPYRTLSGRSGDARPCIHGDDGAKNLIRDERMDRHQLLAIRRERWRRRCRADLVSFAVEALAARGELPARHHRRFCAELEALARGEVDCLMILAPPGSAKTTYASRLFPAQYFATQPRTNIIAASHTAELAERTATTCSVSSATMPRRSAMGWRTTTGACGDARERIFGSRGWGHDPRLPRLPGADRRSDQVAPGGRIGNLQRAPLGVVQF